MSEIIPTNEHYYVLCPESSEICARLECCSPPAHPTSVPAGGPLSHGAWGPWLCLSARILVTPEPPWLFPGGSSQLPFSCSVLNEQHLSHCRSRSLSVSSRTSSPCLFSALGFTPRPTDDFSSHSCPSSDCCPRRWGLLVSVTGENQPLLGLSGWVLLALRFPLPDPVSLVSTEMETVNQGTEPQRVAWGTQKFRYEHTLAREPSTGKGRGPTSHPRNPGVPDVVKGPADHMKLMPRDSLMADQSALFTVN